MTSGTEMLWLLIACTAPMSIGNGGVATPAITAEVRALHVQPIYTPAADGDTVTLRYFVEDGVQVRPGETVLRVDPGQRATDLRKIEREMEVSRATAAKEIAELQVAWVDAELALIDVEADFAKASIDAALPRELLSALDYDRYQGELRRTEREFARMQRELREAHIAVERRQHDLRLEQQRLGMEQKYLQAGLAAAEVRADRAGVVLHRFFDMTGKRYDQDSASLAGQQVGEVVSAGAMGVRAYALETDRSYFSTGSQVTVEFDAIPDTLVTGRIEAISAAPGARPQWGDGRYFTIDIELPQHAQQLSLLAGMSAKVRAVTVARATLQ